jgi:YidC/Oxa1 family membrane protein insertase
MQRKRGLRILGASRQLVLPPTCLVLCIRQPPCTARFLKTSQPFGSTLRSSHFPKARYDKTKAFASPIIGSLSSVPLYPTRLYTTEPTSSIDLPDNTDGNVSTQLLDIPAPTEASVEVASSHVFPLVNWMIDGLTYIHQSVPLPWWATIIAVTVGIRVLLLPVVFRSIAHSTKLRKIQPELLQLRDYFSNVQDPVARQTYLLAVRDLMRKHEIKFWRGFALPLLQAPIFITMFLSLRHLANTVPSFHHGGLLWFTDLAAADPYFLFPALTSLTFLATLELGSDGISTDTQGVIVRNLMRFMGIAMIPLTSGFPMAVHLYWTASNLFSLAQLSILKIPGLKQKLGIPELPAQNKLERPVTFANKSNFSNKRKSN